MKYLFSITLLCFIHSSILYAQHPGTTHKKRETPETVSTDNADDGSDNDDPLQKSYFSIGANYLSDNVYLGRKDTFAVPYISPYIGYNFKNGIYVKALESYQATKVNPHFDLFTCELGYSHLFWNALSASTAFDKYFYNDSSANIKSSIKSSLLISLLYMNNYIEPQASIIFDRTQANKTDIVANIGIDHTFFLLKDKMDIIPTIIANAGTQNYYNESEIKRITKTGNKDSTTGVNRKPEKSSNTFEFLDYELSVQVIYKLRDWVFLLVPTYTIPINPSTATVTITTRTTNKGKVTTASHDVVTTEKISNNFFLELDISHRFHKKAGKRTSNSQ